MQQFQFIDPVEEYHITENGMVISNSQLLNNEFWADLEEAKENFEFRLNGLTHVAQVPEALWDNWIRQGVDVNNLTSREIIAKLRKDEMTKFIVSGDKRF